MDKATGREVVNADAALGFNHYVYDRYATVGQSNHNSSKFADIGNLALISSRDVGGPAAVLEATEDARGQQVVLEQRVAGATWLRTSLPAAARSGPPGDRQPAQQAEHLGQGERLLRLPLRR